MMTFYHGTTDAFNIKKILLPPTYTNNLREEWRKKYQNVVFFTTSPLSAHRFARKACEKYDEGQQQPPQGGNRQAQNLL